MFNVPNSQNKLNESLKNSQCYILSNLSINLEEQFAIRILRYPMFWAPYKYIIKQFILKDPSLAHCVLPCLIFTFLSSLFFKSFKLFDRVYMFFY